MNNKLFRSIPVYCSTAGNERVIQRKNARERERVGGTEREHVKDGSWIADYIYMKEYKKLLVYA